jgi:hypothetical protein
MFDFVRSLLNPQQRPEDAEREKRDRLLAEVRDRYRRELLANHGALDRDRAVSIVRRLYENAGLKSPKLFLWCDLPEDALIAATLVSRDRLAKQLSLEWQGALDSILLGRRLRLAAMDATSSLTDDELRAVARWLPSTSDACTVFRDRLGGRGLLALNERTPFAIDTWLDAFLHLEQHFAPQSAEFTREWNEAAKCVYAMGELDHKSEVRHLGSLGSWILQAHTDLWNWSAPPLLAGSLEIIYAAITELHFGADAPGLPLLLDFIRHCGWCFPFTDLCIMSERPDELFTLEEIQREPNVEVRRLMIELYGFGRFIAGTNAELLQHDSFGELYRTRQPDDEDLIVVKVINSTAEPDGTFREYFLRVPPEIRSARAGIAWSFGLEEWEYKPQIET